MDNIEKDNKDFAKFGTIKNTNIKIEISYIENILDNFKTNKDLFYTSLDNSGCFIRENDFYYFYDNNGVEKIKTKDLDYKEWIN